MKEAEMKKIRKKFWKIELPTHRVRIASIVGPMRKPLRSPSAFSLLQKN